MRTKIDNGSYRARARENRGVFLAVYTNKVRITVAGKETTIIREGHGTGEGRGDTPGEVHDTAIKAAETDATKRALATFGRPFGLELYKTVRPHKDSRSDQTSVSQAAHKVSSGAGPHTLSSWENRPSTRETSAPVPAPAVVRASERPENPTSSPAGPAVSGQCPIPRPSPLLASEAPHSPSPKIDKNVLTFGEPKRIRDKFHLRFVATQPCLICGRKPSDAHHLRFAQLRALGRKVSGEFTVPLCRIHHRELHQIGNEPARWEDLDINALEIAKGLWEKSRFRTSTGSDAQALPYPVDGKKC